jgi:hypothetical protein
LRSRRVGFRIPISSAPWRRVLSIGHLREGIPQLDKPHVFHQIYFGLLVATLSLALPEVITMNDPVPWAHPGGYILGYPVYGLHILVLGGLMYRFTRVRLVTLSAWGGLFGLYEGYLIKQLWNPNWGEDATLAVGGVRVLQTLLLVFFVHTVLAFVLPLAIAELFLSRRGPVCRTLRVPASGWGMAWAVVGTALWLGLLIGGNLADRGGREAFGAPAIAVTVVAVPAAVWRWGLKGHRFRIQELMPHGAGLWVLCGLLAVEYAVYSRLIRPEAMPTEWLPHVMVVAIYAFLVALVWLWGTPRPATENSGPDVMVPARFAVLGAAVFLLVAWVHAPYRQPGQTVAALSFVGGGVVNVVFLGVCLVTGVLRRVSAARHEEVR